MGVFQIFYFLSFSSVGERFFKGGEKSDRSCGNGDFSFVILFAKSFFFLCHKNQKRMRFHIRIESKKDRETFDLSFEKKER